MRTIENVRLLKKVILKELNQLPKTNQLGCSNECDIIRLHAWIIDLTHIEHFGSVSDESSEISLWFKDEGWNPLCHYDILLDEFNEYEEILKLAARIEI